MLSTSQKFGYAKYIIDWGKSKKRSVFAQKGENGGGTAPPAGKGGETPVWLGAPESAMAWQLCLPQQSTRLPLTPGL